ncbi:sterile alpha motif domain-containing protein 1-like isoform X2 [Myxocyprinus asiaticus]|uniref:sterile alpha motif domain-containing protein 1-like isoform X2 n=1 Tax=Myxocyprinus asiaticus TaxID=70543 RepID=UPI002221AEAD|nr:sterile alpha motif domain-containing protein 1-like isoform X2 [Myxocyprinus asiaticus]
MSEPKYRQWILETIDSLRSRKARPDLERICRMVRRRHGSDPDQTRAELEKLIQEQTVLKVSYKGSISYRNAAKVQRKCRKRTEPNGGESVREQTKHANINGDREYKESEDRGVSPCPAPLPQTSLSTLEKGEMVLPTHGCGATGSSVKTSASKDKRLITHDASRANRRPEGEKTRGDDNSPPQRKPKLKVGAEGGSPGENSADLGDRLVVAVRSLSESHRRGHAPLGLKEILGSLSTQSGTPGEKLTRNRVKVVLEREIEVGRLRRSRLGHISLPARASKPSVRLLKSALQDRHLSGKDEVKEEERMETGSEEDGTEDNLTGLDEDAPRNITDGGPTVVKACTDPISTDMEVENENGIDSPMTSEGKSQSSLELSNQCTLLQEVDVGGNEEQTMSVESEDTGTENSAVTPDQLNPSIEDQVIVMSETVKAPLSIPIRNCSGCKMEVSSCLLTPSASPGAAEERGMNEGIGGFVKLESNGLNPVDWTVADVASYFTTAGFPEQALAFRTQEIDGKSLLLMQRNDVLTGLSIRLGPALKIYERHVKVLQKTHFQDDEALC